MTETAQRKQQIEARLKELGVRLQRIEDVLDDTDLSDLEDQTIEWEDDEVQAGIGRANLREAQALTAALNRIAKGTYGTCISCGEQIADERLDAIPYANQCRYCAGASSAEV
ncbi:TraR/DksA C4-type zinc finger protein [Aliiroseovarius sediminis]|uniref:TraR/DksA family transcriptional regulator n=1 Tax=Aliiroseovarius sediminis TaxID=2925839 RepID=UPI001F584608|nr:TraR/DksA C4-type zinc finger protein [Aliiroseovarius sediminis]MCI2395993.1 TraR/DksA C4-type zinc finger protein [Aliiroseovarius sediminis]